MKCCVIVFFVVVPGLFECVTSPPPYSQPELIEWTMGSFGDWLLSWLENDADAQVAFAMMVFPIAMNVFQVRFPLLPAAASSYRLLQFVIVDSILKSKPTSEHDDDSTSSHGDGRIGGGGSGDPGDERGPLFLVDEDYDEEADQEAAVHHDDHVQISIGKVEEGGVDTDKLLGGPDSDDDGESGGGRRGSNRATKGTAKHAYPPITAKRQADVGRVTIEATSPPTWLSEEKRGDGGITSQHWVGKEITDVRYRDRIV
jgi:hypothetical protein